MLDVFTKKRIQKIMTAYIEAKVTKYGRNQLKLNYKFRGDTVTLNEEKIAYMSDQRIEMPIAQFRLEQNKWKIYWRDSRKKWHFVDDFTPETDFEKQLKIVDDDVRGMFWS